MATSQFTVNKQKGLISPFVSLPSLLHQDCHFLIFSTKEVTKSLALFSVSASALTRNKAMSAHDKIIGKLKDIFPSAQGKIILNPHPKRANKDGSHGAI